MQVGESGPVARLIIAYDTNADESILAFEHVIRVVQFKFVLLCHTIIQGLAFVAAYPDLPTGAGVRIFCVVEVASDGPTGRHDGIVLVVNVQPDDRWQAVFGFGRWRLTE